MEPDISFAHSKQDLVVRSDLRVWRRLRHRYGYHEKEYLELAQGIMMCANVTVFCNATRFPDEAAEFPDTTARFEVAPAVVEVSAKKLTITVKDYEQQPLQLFKTANHGFFIRHYGIRRENRLRFDLKAWISFRLPKSSVRDKMEWTLDAWGSHFESNRGRH